MAVNSNERLRAENISHVYSTSGRRVTVLSGLNFYANENEFVSIVGPSGCGKSTLFNIIAGLIRPSSGSVYVASQDTTGRSHPLMGYVLQKDLLLAWRTVIDNVIL